MSVYTGALGGVLDRLRVFMRDGKLGDRHTDRLFRNRISKAVARFHASAALIRDCAELCYSDSNLRPVMLNVVKTQVSEAVLEGGSLLNEALGLTFALGIGDPLGLEIYSRDVRAAPLMVHNDMFHEHLFDQWYTKAAQLHDDA